MYKVERVNNTINFLRLLSASSADMTLITITNLTLSISWPIAVSDSRDMQLGFALGAEFFIL